MMWDDVCRQMAAELDRLEGRHSLFVRSLVTGESFGVNEHAGFPSQSSIKTAIMIQLFRRVEAGAISLDQRVPVQNHARTEGSTALKELQPGAELTVRDLCTLMIIISDNVATNHCIDLAGGFGAVNGCIADLGLRRTMLRRKMLGRDIDFPETDNQTSAWDLVRLFELIVRGQAASVQSCLEMLGILRRQQLGRLMGLFLPPGTPHATKDGGGTRISVGAGLIWTPQGPFAISICAQGWRHPVEPQYRLSRVARWAYDYFSGAPMLSPCRLPESLVPEYLHEGR